ncbi:MULTISPECIES: PilN domain-containing protein [Clostridium]|uniref:Fimbrial assembly protein (PilN) n=1 Tax=Clostridium cadaveris TaxID=1529 RepID=A0A1I2LEQ2_9CLOT|nr:PilN domain-containing protein [Clostridium cadaveris]MDU4951683.1 PilN domain-containing protein [Clostridium sp.]MDM8311300.1 PilN domain-containing protein [Clostridium cadaveris]NME64695.1 PilN domain-containing protein [Clostridium cadaveris]NWK09627.1 PilN domain-containing protein [Clostridium cadaveris]PWL52438.1 MAG: hypothetical protein DBY38_10930 [Clostridium cadaveris]
MRDFNFFEPYIGESKKNNMNFICSTIIPSLVGLFIVVTFSLNKIYEYKLKSEMTQYNNEIKAKGYEIGKVDEQEKKLSILNKYYEEVSKVQADIESKDDIDYKCIHDVKGAMPKELSLYSIEMKESLVTVTGRAKSRENIAELQKNFRGLEYFEEVSMYKIEETKAGEEFSFMMKCTLKGGQLHESK